MEFIRELHFNNESEVRDFALEVSKTLNGKTTLALIGDLGTGKTTFTKYLGEGLGVKEEITSPTFLIVKSYEGRIRLNHFDIYRLYEEGDIEEALYNIGFDEYLDSDSVNVIEWADYILDLLPEDTKYIYIESKGNLERIYRCTF